MKRSLTTVLCVLLTLSLLLAGCAPGEAPQLTEETARTTEPAPTEAPTEATEEPTEAPTEPEPRYTNPLTGESMDAPQERRIVSISIGNTGDAMPTYGLNQADLVFEMYVNHMITRLMAMYTDPTDVPAIGSIRSHRYLFTDLAISYDTIAAHAGGSNIVMRDANRSGVDHMNIDTGSSTYYSFRDGSRYHSGYLWEHCLFANGAGLYELAQSKGYSTDFDRTKDYGLKFAEDEALTEGETANTVTLTFQLSGHSKKTVMNFNPETGLYEFTQDNRAMVDGNTGENVSFRNVFVILANTWTDGDAYQISDIVGTGDGFFACDGYMIPIRWVRRQEGDVFTFTLEDGTPLLQGVGRSYLAIAPLLSTVTAE